MNRTFRLISNFLGLLAIVVLFSSTLLADVIRPVPTVYAKFLRVVNVQGAWEKGYTGNGVTVAVVDYEVEITHPYFRNVSKELSHNFGARLNGTGTFEKINDEQTGVAPLKQDPSDPSPVWDNFVYTDSEGYYYTAGEGADMHGTSCAGCIAAYSNRDNVYGTAYDVTLVGIRMDYIQSDDTDVFNCAIMRSNKYVQLKSNSYTEDGGYNTVEVSQIKAFEDAKINNTGMIFCACNERNVLDNSNCSDSNKKFYAVYPYTIVVGATGNTAENVNYNKFADFSNYGACIFVCAPGQAILTADNTDRPTKYFYNYEDDEIKDFDIANVSKSDYQGYVKGNFCDDFDGTSAATPIATGVMALGIDAYQQTNLGKRCNIRFLKHMLARTSSKIDTLATEPETRWGINSAGLSFSHTYGFGQVNATALVNAIDGTQEYRGSVDRFYTDVTKQTVATQQWVQDSSEVQTKQLSHKEKLLYDPVEPESQEIYQALPMERVVKRFVMTFTDDDFKTAGIAKQCLEEVVLTVDLSNSDNANYFDSRFLQITVEHQINGRSTLSYMSFAEPKTAKDENCIHGNLQWSYCSNAFWGEDPTGTWIVTFTFIKSSSNGEFNINNLWTTFYMGELININDNLDNGGTLKSDMMNDNQNGDVPVMGVPIIGVPIIGVPVNSGSNNNGSSGTLIPSLTPRANYCPF